MRGMSTSETTRSKRSLLRVVQASRPSTATLTWYPASSSRPRSIARVVTASSTTSTHGGPSGSAAGSARARPRAPRRRRPRGRPAAGSSTSSPPPSSPADATLRTRIERRLEVLDQHLAVADHLVDQHAGARAAGVEDRARGALARSALEASTPSRSASAAHGSSSSSWRTLSTPPWRMGSAAITRSTPSSGSRKRWPPARTSRPRNVAIVAGASSRIVVPCAADAVELDAAAELGRPGP